MVHFITVRYSASSEGTKAVNKYMASTTDNGTKDSNIARCLKEGNYASRIGGGAPVYLAAVLEYLAAELLERIIKKQELFQDILC